MTFEEYQAITERTVRLSYFRSIAHLEPHRIDSNAAEGWSQYRRLKYRRNVGWWKDHGLHELARKMVALGIPDAPVALYIRHKGSTEFKHCLNYKSLYWIASTDVSDNDAKGTYYYKHADNDLAYVED